MKPKFHRAIDRTLQKSENFKLVHIASYSLYSSAVTVTVYAMKTYTILEIWKKMKNTHKKRRGKND